MEWIQVNSTSIAAIGYDPDRSELGVEFRSTGHVYLYLNVPSEEYRAFVNAESKGDYLNGSLKSRGYAYTGPHLGRDQ